MKEVRFDTAESKATDAFFDEYPPEYSPLQSYNGGAKFRLRDDDPASEQLPVAKYLKQFMLFFPGAFILFYVSLGTTLFIKRIVENPDEKHLLFYMIGFCALFMTWFGLGDIKNKKHLVVPASIIFANVVIGIIVHLTRDFFWLADKVFRDFDYAICLFPISLIVPFLAKGWVDSISDRGIRNSD